MHLPERIRRSVDAVVAVALAALIVLSVVTDPGLEPKPALLVLGLVSTVPLAWRRRSPAVVATTCTVGYAVLNGVSNGPYPPDIAILPAMVAVFSGAHLTKGRTALVVGATTFVAVEIAWVLTPDGHWNDFLPWVLWGGPFGVGRLTRRRDTTVSELTDQARHLEELRTDAEREAAHRERDRIARELHDVIAHAVSLMVVQAGAERLALSASGTDPERTTTALHRIEQAGREALGELRTMLGVLRDAQDGNADADGPLDPQPRLNDAPDLVDRLLAEGVDVHLDIVGDPPQLADAVSLSAYRIVQEGLTNAVKHGTSGRVEVRIEYGADAVTLEVTNPCGPPPPSTVPGYGLVGARERALSVGGVIQAHRRDRTWVLCARLPYAPAVVGQPG